MTDAQKINDLLHSEPVTQHYSAKTGDQLEIKLPKIPLTRYTEFVRLAAEKFGDMECFVETDSIEDEGEGHLLPSQITGRAVCPGTIHILLRAVDSLSGEEIAEVTPLDIEVEVRER